MLETIREYAALHMGQICQEAALRERHARYYLALAEHAGNELLGPRQIYWVRLLRDEQENLRAAVRWFLPNAQIADGMRMKEIASTLGLSTRTVETHKYEMMRILGVDSTATLVRYALEHDLITR